MMHRTTARTLLAWAAIVAAPGVAMAQTADGSTPAAPPPAADASAAPAPAPAPNLTANISVTTNYKFRGQDQDMLGHAGYAKTNPIKPAIQGGFDYTFGDTGFYVGNWNSSVNWLTGNSVEMDFYGGYRFKGGPIDWDVGIYQYYYPGNTAGNTTELYGGGTWSSDALGAFTLKYSQTVSRDYFNYAGADAGSGLRGRNTGYLNLGYSKELIPKLTFKAALGYTHMSGDIRSLGYRSFFDYNVGASWDFGSGLSLNGAIQGATQQKAYQVLASPGIEVPGFGPVGASYYSPNKARLVVWLTKTL